MWGIIPAAGRGSRIQPLAFSKELLPVGSRQTAEGVRPRAVTEYLLDRMILAGVDRICFVIAPEKTDIVEYFGAAYGGAEIVYVIQPAADGLCDAIFRAHTVIAQEEEVTVGLPDTVWFPQDALCTLPSETLSFLLFPVDRPELFDAVVQRPDGHVREIQVKKDAPATHWVWGAFRMPGTIFSALRQLWLSRDQKDEYIGTLVNAFLESGGDAIGVRCGEEYVDVGTVNGYRAAADLLSRKTEDAQSGAYHTVPEILRPATQIRRTF